MPIIRNNKLFNILALTSLKLVSLFCGSRPSKAAPPPATGSIGAQVLVSGTSMQRTAMNEAKPGNPMEEAQETEQEAEPVSQPTQQQTSKTDFNLPSRLEVTAGTDRLVRLSNVWNQVSLFGEARYRLTKHLQLGASGALRLQGNGDATDQALQVLLGPTFNFGGADDKIQDAFFVTPKMGITAQRTVLDGKVQSSALEPTFALNAGKRFALGKNVSYAPSVGVLQQLHHSPVFVVQPIAISIFF